MNKLLRLLLALAVLASAATRAAETVTWIIYDAPPQYIFEGPLMGQGYKDIQLAWLTAHLPQFEHRVVKGSVSRLWYEIGHRDGVCTLGMLPNKEREDAAALASRPVLIPGFHLAVAIDRTFKFAPFLDAQGEVDLGLLAGSRRLKGGAVAGRVHAKAIEDFLGRTDRASPLEPIVSPLQLYSLVKKGRIDYTFGSPHEIRYFAKILADNEVFAALPIRGVPRLVKTYLSCSKQPVGEAVIAAADSVLSDDAQWAAFLTPLRSWMSSQDMTAALAIQPAR